MQTCVKIQFQGPSREKGRLLSNCLSNMSVKKVLCFLFFLKVCIVPCFFPVNTEDVIKHQL